MINLHIGGKTPHPDWKILNILPGDHVDFVRDAKDLAPFEDESIQNIYASHVLEHLSIAELTPCLHEWHRVLTPDGQLMISVPNLEVLCRLFASGECDVNERFFIMKMIMGAQTDPNNFHQSAFDIEILSHFLAEAGFESICKVETFGIFHDCSEIRIKGTLISLNTIVRK